MPQDFGIELFKDQCPEKYYCKSSLYKDIVPVIIAAVIVAFFSGNLLISSGLGWLVSLLIEVGFILLFSLMFYVLFGGIKKRLSQTYISIREKGICGIYAVNGYRNAPFQIPYEDITYVSYQGDRAVIETKQGKLTFVLEQVSKTVELICKQANI